MFHHRITQQVTQNLEKAGSWQKPWGTFKQVRKNGVQVNKGEKSYIVVFWKLFKMNS